MPDDAPRIDLDTSLGYLVKEAAVALRSAMEAVLRPSGLTVTQYSCLELLHQRPGLSSSGLARGTFVTRQSMHVLLQGLEQQGLVSRPEEPPVGRALPARLTDRGHGVLAEASAAVRGVERAMQHALPADRQDELRRMLALCVDALRRLPS